MNMIAYNTERTKHLINEFKVPSRFSSEEIHNLYLSELNRRPANSSKKAGLEQQEE